MSRADGGCTCRADARDADGLFSPSKLLDVTEQAMSRVPSMPGSERMCIFCTDRCSVAADVISDAANEVAGTYLPHVCDRRVPGWVVRGVTAVVVSCDGDDEGMVEVLRELASRGCEVLCISSGGALERTSAELGARFTAIPDGISEGEVPWHVLGTIAATVQACGIFDAADMLSRAILGAKLALGDLAEHAVEISRQLEGGVVAAYSTSDVRAIAPFWRMTLGEATGDISFCGELPEFDHNELVGWSDQNVHAPELRILVIRSGVRSALVGTIVRCMLEVLEENGRRTVVADVGGGSSMDRDVKGMVLAVMVASIIGRRVRWPG